jgi:hypothetical protein
MEYLLITTENDLPMVKELVNRYMVFPLEDLVQSYNRSVDTGIVGSRAQALSLFALGVVFKKKTGQSPVQYASNVLSLTGKIVQAGESYQYVVSLN